MKYSTICRLLIKRKRHLDISFHCGRVVVVNTVSYYETDYTSLFALLRSPYSNKSNVPKWG